MAMKGKITRTTSKVPSETDFKRLRGMKSDEKTMRRALRRKPFLDSDGRYLTREEAHDRARLR